MRRLFTICLLALSATALLVGAPAASAAKKAAKPKITRVTPMRISVGATLTIRGKNFKPERAANTVIFRAPNGRSAFAKPRRASRGKLVVVVPGAASRLLGGPNGDRPTRLKLRVLAGKKFSAFTPRRLSPVVTAFGAGDGPGGGSGGGGGGGAGAAICNNSSDHDGDLLANDLELQIKTDPCLADTDGDGVEDGYEYQAALDLNQNPRTPPLPYPGKRPFPNPLDPVDGKPGGTDYDGDGLVLYEEFLLWMRYSADGVRRQGRPGTLSGLLYSDGLQMSIDSPPPPAPADPLYNWSLDFDEDDVLSDDQRDADADGLGNWDEVRGQMLEAWWPAQHNGQNEPKESVYPNADFLDNEDLPGFDAHTDPDVDGDGVLDGADDYDHDGLSNQFEVRRPDDWLTDAFTPIDTNGDGTPESFGPGPNPWAYTQPFNPCKPFNSERCHRHPPFGHYVSDQVPPIGPDPPPGYPGGGPATPDG
jgi:hypothetical protein